MDRLSKIIKRNGQFQKRFFADRGLDISKLSEADKAHWSKEYVIHVTRELHELLDETNWKMHKIGGAPPIVSNIIEEWIDCLKFLVGLANIWGFTDKDIFEEFERKSQVVEYRYSMEQRLRSISPYDPVIGVDIDGVLNEYPKPFHEWLLDNAAEFKIGNKLEDYGDIKVELGIKSYNKYKDLYRQSGAKRYQSVREGAKELLNGIRAAGGIVILLSKRPYWKFNRIYADTLQWLDNNGLRFDGVLFDKEKHRKIVNEFPGLIAMVEDDPIIAREIISIGKHVVLVKGELNNGIDIQGSILVDGPNEALEEILKILKENNVR